MLRAARYWDGCGSRLGAGSYPKDLKSIPQAAAIAPSRTSPYYRHWPLRSDARLPADQAHVMKPREEGRFMRKQIALLSVVGFFGLLAAANAQSLSALPPSAAFDGTYRFVSSAKVNEMYTSMNGGMLPCPDRIPGPLTIAQGEARYTTATGDQLEGTVGPQGELEMRVIGGWRLPANGAAHVRRTNRQHWHGTRPPSRWCL